VAHNRLPTNRPCSVQLPRPLLPRPQAYLVSRASRPLNNARFLAAPQLPKHQHLFQGLGALSQPRSPHSAQRLSSRPVCLVIWASRRLNQQQLLAYLAPQRPVQLQIACSVHSSKTSPCSLVLVKPPALG
jgi:hypothetical protein